MLNRAMLLAVLLTVPVAAMAASAVPLPRDRPETGAEAASEPTPLPRERPAQMEGSSAGASSAEPAAASEAFRAPGS